MPPNSQNILKYQAGIRLSHCKGFKAAATPDRTELAKEWTTKSTERNRAPGRPVAMGRGRPDSPQGTHGEPSRNDRHFHTWDRTN